MIKDFLISFKDNFKEKTRNPFLGTYLIVWLIRNWELVYTLFNFDNNQKLVDKVEFIKNYYDNNEFLLNLWTNVYWSFGLLILTYLLLNLSRLITNLSEKRLTPWIYKITDSKSVVLKETYNILQIENNHLEQKLEKERDSKNRLQVEITKLEQKIDNFTNSDKTKIETEDNSNLKNLENEIDVLFHKIKDKEWSNDYIDAVSLINKDEFGWVENNYINDRFEYFIKLGLINIEKSEKDYTQFTISEIGEKILRRARLEL